MDLEYDKLDDDWINNFENTDKLYKDFYKDDLYYVNLRVIYINRENEIEKLKQESFLMSKPNNIECNAKMSRICHIGDMSHDETCVFVCNFDMSYINHV